MMRGDGGAFLALVGNGGRDINCWSRRLGMAAGHCVAAFILSRSTARGPATGDFRLSPAPVLFLASLHLALDIAGPLSVSLAYMPGFSSADRAPLAVAWSLGLPQLVMENGTPDAASVETRADHLMPPYSAQPRWCREYGRRSYPSSSPVSVTAAAGLLLVQHLVPLSLRSSLTGESSVSRALTPVGSPLDTSCLPQLPGSPHAEAHSALVAAVPILQGSNPQSGPVSMPGRSFVARA